MKKKLLLIICISSFFKIYAQQPQVEFSIKGGVTLPEYSYVGNGTTERRSLYQGFTGGVTVMLYKLNREIPELGLGIGVDYVQAGAINKQPAIVGAVQAKNRITYVRGQVLLGAKVQRFLEIKGGLYFAKAISGESVITNTNGATTTTPFIIGEKVTDDFIPFDLGLGMIADFNINSKIQLGFSIHQGLSDIAPQTDIKINNSIYAITLGMKLGGRKK